MLSQADWIPGSDARANLFRHVADALNAHAGSLEFLVEDGPTGPLIRHAPSNAGIGLRPSLPVNEKKPFDLWVRLTHRFPMKADGTFNVKLVVQRVRELEER